MFELFSECGHRLAEIICIMFSWFQFSFINRDSCQINHKELDKNSSYLSCLLTKTTSPIVLYPKYTSCQKLIKHGARARMTSQYLPSKWSKYEVICKESRPENMHTQLKFGFLSQLEMFCQFLFMHKNWAVPVETRKFTAVIPPGNDFGQWTMANASLTSHRDGVVEKPVELVGTLVWEIRL